MELRFTEHRPSSLARLDWLVRSFFAYTAGMYLRREACSAGALHRELNSRAAWYARSHGLLHELTTGRTPSVLFGEDDRGNHGNFHPASYRALCADPAWRARLGKAHTAGRRALPRADWHWRELDCAASSDALLMNVFCYPQLFRSGRIAALLGVSGSPVFGVKPRLARERALVDTTEIDMALSPAVPATDSLENACTFTAETVFFEAKLTESGFQTASPRLLSRYPGWDTVLDAEALPRTAGGAYQSYQLIRGVLAAAATGGSFCVLCDARRADLVAHWHAVIAAAGSAALRCRLKLLTWQELAGAVPAGLRGFLAEKYGIYPARSGSFDEP